MRVQTFLGGKLCFEFSWSMLTSKFRSPGQPFGKYSSAQVKRGCSQGPRYHQSQITDHFELQRSSRCSKQNLQKRRTSSILQRHTDTTDWYRRMRKYILTLHSSFINPAPSALSLPAASHSQSELLTRYRSNSAVSTPPAASSKTATSNPTQTPPTPHSATHNTTFPGPLPVSPTPCCRDL